jgi:Mg-chelatase subunit ChlD
MRHEDRPAVGHSTIRLLIVLDRSLSMAPHEQQVTIALRDFVAALKSAPEQPRYVVTLVTFADEPTTVCLHEPLEKLAIDYRADGKSTALWDALGHALVLEKSRHERVICVIVTDGEDNHSSEADQKQVAAMVRTRLEWGNWTFVWLSLTGKPSKAARAMNVECLTTTCGNVGKALPEVGGRISRAARAARGNPPIQIEQGRH